MVEPGAFARAIRRRGAAGIRMLYQHDPAEPIGTWLDIAEDERGLLVRGRLTPGVGRAREVLELMRAGALDGLSIGFRTVRARKDAKAGLRRIVEADLWEISVVTFPMLPGARVESVKGGRALPSTREFERWLTRDAKLTRLEARAVIARGFASLVRERDAARGTPTALAAKIREAAQLTEEDIAAGLFDGATVATLLVNWREPAQFAPVRAAVIGRIARADGRFVAELESRAASLDKPNGRYLRRGCDARLGDARCRVDLAREGLRGAGEVLAVTAPATLVAGGLGAFAAGWFAFGEIAFSSGALDGRTLTVVDHRREGEDVVLVLPAAEAMPAPGDAFTIVAGCDKRFATCKAKFANAVNFRGFPHLPGNDAAYAYVTEGMQFDGGALVE